MFCVFVLLTSLIKIKNFSLQNPFNLGLPTNSGKFYVPFSVKPFWGVSLQYTLNNNGLWFKCGNGRDLD